MIKVWTLNLETENKLRLKNYHQITHSRALPQISAKDLTKFLETSRSEGQTAALKSFRRWLGEIAKK